MGKLSLIQAEIIVDTALEARRANGGMPLSVAVLDDGGHIKLLKREDGATLFRADIAIGKAWGAIAMGVSSRMIGQVAQQNPGFVAALNVAAQGKILPNPGGVLIRDASSGEVLGAVGVSGDLPDRDEAFAIAAVNAAGLAPEPASPTLHNHGDRSREG
jgi:uncharacterized protein GlcG (DUF336 family)